MKSLGESASQPEPTQHDFLDSPYPERPTRNYNVIGPTRPPRRASSSSLIDQNKYFIFFRIFRFKIPSFIKSIH